MDSRGQLHRLAGDTLVYGVTTAVVRALNFFLTPLYTNVLSPAELGEVSYLYALLAFVNVVLNLGWESAYMRFAVERQREEQGEVFALAWVGMAVNAGILGAVLWVLAPVLGRMLRLELLGTPGIRLAAAIAVCDALAVVPLAHLRLQRRLGLFSALRLGNAAVTVAATLFFLLVLRWGALGVLWAGLIASAVTAGATAPILQRNFRWRWDGELWREMLRYGLPLVPTALSNIVLQVADRPILMALTDAHSVGIYQANYRLALPMLMFVVVFEYAWRPFFLEQLQRADAPRLFARVFALWNAVAACVFAALALWMPVLAQARLGGVYVLHPAYWEGLGVVPIVAAGYGAYGIYVLAAAAAHIRKRTERLPIAMGAAAGVNVVLTLLLVPQLGYIGAAWATAGAYLVAAALIVVMSRRLYPVPYPWGTVAGFWGVVLLAAVLGGQGETLVARLLASLGAGLGVGLWWGVRRQSV
ncbi:hypothetical protein HRbin21_00796 [bacterium HR21]|nr:hypothetical protein HRbin21_00796 [bacterium HR21]